jgi:hypothetical protein
MNNTDLIAEARYEADRWAEGMWQHDLVTRLADALEAQPAPLVADSREALAAVIHERFNMARGRGGVAPLALADQILESGVVSLAADRDRATAERAWSEGRAAEIEAQRTRYHTTSPEIRNPYRESEGK